MNCIKCNPKITNENDKADENFLPESDKIREELFHCEYTGKCIDDLNF